MTDCDTCRVPTPNGRSAVTGRFNPPPTAGDTTPISDEAITRLIKAFYEAHGVESWESSAEYRYGAEHHWMREAFAEIAPLLVSAEAERRDEFPEHLIAQRDEAQAHLAEAEREVEGLRGEMDSERTARARDLVRYSQDAMFLRLNAAETQRDVALDLVEGLRAELTEAHHNAADEIRREARWQESLRVRGNSGPSWQQSIDRLLAVEQIIRSRSAALRAAGGQECTCPSGDGSLRWPCPIHPPVGGQAEPSDDFKRGRLHQAEGMLAEFEQIAPALPGSWMGNLVRSLRANLNLPPAAAAAAAVSGEHQDATKDAQ